MRAAWSFALAVVLAAGGVSLRAQQPDYLTAEEVELAREVQEPNKRIEMFLGFAELRLAAFEKALHPAADTERPRPWELRDLLNHFIRSIDDTTDNMEKPLDRGGVELKKGRDKAKAKAADFLKRLETIRASKDVEEDEDLRYDLEDAVEAVATLEEVAKLIPDGILPAKALPAEAEKEEAQPAPGKPTLKRRTDKPKDKP
ncbi:MAG: hypothetical protein L0212_02125 [Acidobacteria bacterium]|nr:hypothetical protein [Acidobacteriota bacterium]